MSECPRWKLIEPHYLNIATLPDGTPVEWEKTETNRASGRAVRKLHKVPMLLDPRDPGDHNYPGEIIVAQSVDGGHNLANDYIFTGAPTPGMEPLNEAAQTLTDAERPRWEHPINSLPANGGMTPAESTFMQNMMEAFAKQVQGGTTVPNTSVPREDYEALQERLAKLEALIAAQNTPKPVPAADAVARRA